MKINKRILVIMICILGLAGCGKKHNDMNSETTEITNLQTFEATEEIIPATTEVTTESPAIDVPMRKLKEGQYQLDIPDCKKIFDFEVCDNYLAITKMVDESNKLCIIDLNTGKEIKCYDVQGIFLDKLENGELLYSCYTGEGLLFHDITEEPEKLNESEMTEYLDSLQTEIKEINDFDIEMVSTNQSFIYEREDYIVTAYMDDDNEWWVPIYQTKDNKLCYMDSIVEVEDNYSLTECAIDGKNVFLLFYNNEINENIIYCIEPGSEEIPVPEVHGVYPDGITIFTGEEVVLPETEGYIREIVDDEYKINLVSNQLDLVFEKYPDGFWNELLYEGNCPRKSLVICLCGAIYNEGGYVENPEGFAFQSRDTNFVLVDISYATEDSDYSVTFYHELMHTIDAALYDKNEEYEGWKDLLPEAFEYNEYEQTEDNVLYSENLEDVYFVSSYGKTNQLEDTATTMAAMMDFGMDYYKNCGPLYKRMQYMDEMLKKNFRTIRECDNPYWDR